MVDSQDGDSRIGHIISNESQLGPIITRMAHEMMEKIAHLSQQSSCTTILVGIPTRGVTLAQRFAAYLSSNRDTPIDWGQLDITFYRDDLTAIPRKQALRTILPLTNIDNTHIILVDDVLYTGRSVLSALDALRDIGRPHSIELAVLVDRGHREVPISANYIGKTIPTLPGEEIKVQLQENDGCEYIALKGAESNPTRVAAPQMRGENV